MKIFTTKEIKAIDARTVELEKISQIDLMERAATSVAYEIMSRWRPDRRFVVFAGPGNNGGDALAVARLLWAEGYTRIEVFFFNVPSSRLSDCCRINRDRLVAVNGIDYTEVVGGEFDPPALSYGDVVIDGLFGSGLMEPLKGGFTSLVQYINDSKAFVVSIDTPSGLLGEWNLGDRRNIVRANLTFAFQFKRLSFFFAENAEFVGECKVLDIALNQEAMRSTRSNFYLVEDYEVKNVLRSRPLHCNKYNFGNMLLVAGSYGMYGAAVLAARAAMRSGVGLMTVHGACSGHDILQISVPEAKYESTTTTPWLSVPALAPTKRQSMPLRFSSRTTTSLVCSMPMRSTASPSGLCCSIASLPSRYSRLTLPSSTAFSALITAKRSACAAPLRWLRNTSS